jgi:hypothetical protein
LLEREPFAEQAARIMKHCISGEVKGYLASHTILNIFYITRKELDLEARKDISLMLCDKFNTIGISPEMIRATLKKSNFKDLEDGLQMQSALEKKVDFIITRDIKGFKDSETKALLPGDFLTLIV